MSTAIAFVATVIFVIAALSAFAVISWNPLGWAAIGLAVFAAAFWLPSVLGYTKTKAE